MHIEYIMTIRPSMSTSENQDCIQLPGPAAFIQHLSTETARTMSALPDPRHTLAMNGITDGITNGITNGITDGITNGTSNGITNGASNGITNGFVDGHTHSTNAHVNGYANDHSNGDTPKQTGFSVPIAICGMAMRLPGGIRDAEGFWDVLYNGEDKRCPIPSDRYNAKAFSNALGKKGAIKTQYGYFLDDDLSCLNASFFSMTKADLERTDPQQRQILEVTRECLESAVRSITGESQLDVFLEPLVKIGCIRSPKRTNLLELSVGAVIS